MFIERFYRNNYVPSRLVRYGIVYGTAARDSLSEFEPKVDPMLKAQAELLVEHLNNFIEACERLDEQTDETPTVSSSEATKDESDDIEAAKV